MFSFFKKKPILNNEAHEGLSIMLFDDPESPVRDDQFFNNKSMDFSIESLQTLDEYLESQRSSLPENEALVRIALRAGSYIGEVIRKHSRIEYHWIEFSEAKKINRQVKGAGFGLGTSSILWSKPETFVFPIAKVLKRLENGSEDSVYVFAKVVIDGLPD